MIGMRLTKKETDFRGRHNEEDVRYVNECGDCWERFFYRDYVILARWLSISMRF